MRKILIICATLVAVAAHRAGADDEGLRLRLEAFFGAKDEAGREKALEALSAAEVPRDPAARAQAIRRAVPLPARKGASRIEEKLGDLECFFVTPKGQEKKTVPVVLSLHGRSGTGHHGLQPFTLPDEEWNELKKKAEEDVRKRVPAGARVTIKKPAPKVPWEDGLVVAPSWTREGALDDAEGACLAALERLHRSYAGDPDRVVLAGISLGGAAACEVAARHPDRFAGLVAVAGYDPNVVENLRGLPVFVLHGAKDDDVPVAAGREMDARLSALGVEHVYREAPGLGHAWPEPDEGAKLRAWMRERVRKPWPATFAHAFEDARTERRCFWVSLPGGDAASVKASVSENGIDLEVKGASNVTLHLGEPLVDLEKDVIVRWGGAEVFRGKVARSWRTFLQDLDATGFDLPRAAPARLDVRAP